MTKQSAVEELKCYRAKSGTEYPEEIETAIAALEKLAKYEDLEEQGKLLKLPLAVGDTAYTLNPLPSGKTVVAETKADAFFCALCTLEGRFGKTVFATQEEAEQALKDMEEKVGRLTEYDEFGNADIIGVESEDLQCNLEFDEFNRVTKALNKLAGYEDLEEQGKLLKPPCAVGDTIYTNYSMQGWYFRKEKKPYAAKIVFIGINGADNYINADFGNGYMLQFKFSDIGKKFFLTKREAEQALKDLEGESV